MDNERLARAFDELADLLDLAGESPFKTRAYRLFAQNVRESGEPISDVVVRGELLEMDGVGKAIAGKVSELIETGSCDALEKARAQVPTTLLELMKVPGFGTKSVRALWQRSGITTAQELAHACEERTLTALAGFGPKKQERALEAARFLIDEERCVSLAETRRASAAIVDALWAAGASKLELVGEARRGKDLVSGAVVLAVGLDAPEMIRALRDFRPREDTGAIRVDVGRVAGRVVPRSAASWVESLIVETGSPSHIGVLRTKAGGIRAFSAVCAAAKDEADVYARLGLPYCPPELREGTSFEARGDLLDTTCLRGVFHVHTTWSDGAGSIAEMARAAADAGLTYVGISDHSRAASYARGLDRGRLFEQMEEVRRAQEELPQITILHGMEVDIAPDGSLDLDPDTLGRLDFVIASVHEALELPFDEMTARIVRAVSNPLVTILGHPTGRLLGARRGYAFALERVARAAAANDTCLEINANAHRLDLNDTLAKRALDLGARFAINPDAHGPLGFADTSLGVAIARRAGVPAGRVLNTLGRDPIVRALADRKERARGRVKAS